MVPITPTTTYPDEAAPRDVIPSATNLFARDKQGSGAPRQVSPRTAPGARADAVPRDLILVAARHAEAAAIPSFDMLMADGAAITANPDKLVVTPLRHGADNQRGPHAGNPPTLPHTHAAS